jgi:hypothetical protein
MVVIHIAGDQRHPADLTGQVVERLQALRHEPGLEHEVLRRIARQGQFRSHHQVRAAFQALAVGGQNAFGVAGEIPDNRIDLGDSNVHGRAQPTPGRRSGKGKKFSAHPACAARPGVLCPAS